MKGCTWQGRPRQRCTGRGWARRTGVRQDTGVRRDTGVRQHTGVQRNNGVGRSRTRGLNGRMRVLKDSDAVFRAAIRNGVLSDDSADANYAGNYMYLFHDEDGVVWFKHRDSRACLRAPVRGPGAGDSP